MSLIRDFDQVGVLVVMGRTGYGDEKVQSRTEFDCRFREIDQFTRTTNQEQIESDAMFWCDPSVPVAQGSIVMFEDVPYRVIQLTQARGKSSAVIFQKGQLQKFYEVVS